MQFVKKRVSILQSIPIIHNLWMTLLGRKKGPSSLMLLSSLMFKCFNI